MKTTKAPKKTNVHGISEEALGLLTEMDSVLAFVRETMRRAGQLEEDGYDRALTTEGAAGLSIIMQSALEISEMAQNKIRELLEESTEAPEEVVVQ